MNKRGGFYIVMGSIVFLLIVLLTRVEGLFTERLWPDEALYAHFAALIARDMTVAFSPLANEFHSSIFTFILSQGWRIEPSIVGLRCITLLINGLSLVMIFRLGSVIFNRTVGLLAAGLLAANVHFYVHAHLVLADGLLTLLFMIWIDAILWAGRSTDRKSDLVLGGVTLLLILTKWYTVFFVLPLFFIYYRTVIAPSRIREYKKNEIIAWAIVAVPGLYYLVPKLAKEIAKGGPDVFINLPWSYYISALPELSGGKILFILMILAGGWALLMERRKAVVIILLAWVFIPVAVMSCVKGKDLRYILPALPALVLILANGIEKVLEKCAAVHRWCSWGYVLLGGLVLSAVCQLGSMPLWHPLYHGYTGFYEAGAWIKERNVLPTRILAGSVRAILFTATGQEALRMEQVSPLPKTMDGLGRILSENDRVLMEIDAWEYTQPSWAYPMTSEKMHFIEEAGLKLQKTVLRGLGGKTRPVVWIFEKA